ncbi:7890_t:CDS:2, partial [Dentiscutata heterogama]
DRKQIIPEMRLELDECNNIIDYQNNLFQRQRESYYEDIEALIIGFFEKSTKL